MRQTTPNILDNILTLSGAPPAPPDQPWQRRCSELRPHPLNETIYGDRADGDLIASVRAKGILNPILITGDNLIVSGHRRWGAAIAVGLDTVPVVIFGSDDPLDIEEALLDSNEQREKTNEQKGREYKERKRIIAERESRQGSNQYVSKGASASQEAEAPPSKPPTHKAAAQIGISQPTAVRIEAVVDRIDALVAEQKTDEAAVLRQELERSPKAAYNTVRAQQRRERIQAPAFAAPEVRPVLPPDIDIVCADARDLARMNIAPVHLVITSPPYNVGIDYATHNDSMSDDEYQDMLYQVFQQCHRVMVEGARIAVVVPFGVGRDPWTPMPPIIYTLLKATGFTLRGQIVWDKNTTGNRTSWGSFRLPTNPALRDTTEAIIVAHKGNGALEMPEHLRIYDEKGACAPALANADYFMELAQDHWVVAPESAQRVGHPAPFPVQLARRLIDFFAFPGAHVLDPFGGCGSTAVAARQAGCKATLIDIDRGYCDLAGGRVRNARISE